jgi:hypothetical protein
MFTIDAALFHMLLSIDRLPGYSPRCFPRISGNMEFGRGIRRQFIAGQGGSKVIS